MPKLLYIPTSSFLKKSYSPYIQTINNFNIDDKEIQFLIDFLTTRAERADPWLEYYEVSLPICREEFEVIYD